jgi:hypothetical protein
MPREIVSLFLQGRWWCTGCQVMWAGLWPVPDVAPHIMLGQGDWAPVHDCGRVMERTAGDERGDPQP